jgi:hypothetical protein
VPRATTSNDASQLLDTIPEKILLIRCLRNALNIFPADRSKRSRGENSTLRLLLIVFPLNDNR